MRPPNRFESYMVAPCGINCGACYSFLRDKNKCLGCRIDFSTKQNYCRQCIIANCEILIKTDSGFCYDCEEIPCKRLKQLDKRYRTKYKTGLIQNLIMIRDNGIASFLKYESNLRTCQDCGSIISIHRDNCTNCNKTIKKNAL